MHIIIDSCTYYIGVTQGGGYIKSNLLKPQDLIINYAVFNIPLFQGTFTTL